MAAAALGAAGPAPAPPVGVWAGTLTRDGSDLAVSVSIRSTAQGWAARLSARDFRAVDIPLRNTSVAGDEVRFELTGDATTMRFFGRFHGERLAGEIEEDGRRGGFDLRRTSQSAEGPCEERPATFRNGVVVLQGSLLRPRGAARPAAVLIMHGSGPEPRDAGRFLAHALCEGGSAALVYDKRGVGASTGDWRNASFADLAGDAVAGVAWLAAQPNVDPLRLGVYGHSQGGTITPMVANRSAHAAYVIAGAGAAAPMAEVEAFSLENAVRPLTNDPQDLAEARRYIGRLVRVAASGRGVEAFIADAPAWRDRDWFEVVAPPPADAGYWRSARANFGFDAASEWRRVRQPALLIYGDRDERTPVARSVAAVRRAARASGNPSIRIVILPGARHAFDLQTPAGAWPRVAPGYPELIVDYVRNFAPAGR